MHTKLKRTWDMYIHLLRRSQQWLANSPSLVWSQGTCSYRGSSEGCRLQYQTWVPQRQSYSPSHLTHWIHQHQTERDGNHQGIIKHAHNFSIFMANTLIMASLTKLQQKVTCSNLHSSEPPNNDIHFQVEIKHYSVRISTELLCSKRCSAELLLRMGLICTT